VDTTEIQVLYRRATALVFPSLYEGWGLPVVEAFASDLPVATSTATSLPELVGDAAVQFDPYDPAAIAAAIELLWLDDAVREEYVRRGRARVAAFSWERTAEVMRALYRRVAGMHLEPADRDLLAMPPVV
jgi:glycosyltransferase involved in cell wall biosynthesis